MRVVMEDLHDRSETFSEKWMGLADWYQTFVDTTNPHRAVAAPRFPLTANNYNAASLALSERQVAGFSYSYRPLARELFRGVQFLRLWGGA